MARHRWRYLCLLVALVGSLAVAPSALAHHTPYEHEVADLLLPHQLGGSPLLGPLPLGISDLPNLYPFLPTTFIGNTPPWFIDIYEQDNRRLARSDTVIANAAKTLQLYCTSCISASPTIWQMVWPGGEPPPGDEPDPHSIPSNTQYATDITPRGAEMLFSAAQGHNH